VPTAKRNPTRHRGPRDEPGVMLERITVAARASFARNGWAGTTLRGVARQVGVDPALVHYYFSSKEELSCRWPAGRPMTSRSKRFSW
jgi:DNA-binding transcriptional regulator YbjK